MPNRVASGGVEKKSTANSSQKREAPKQRQLKAENLNTVIDLFKAQQLSTYQRSKIEERNGLNVLVPQKEYKESTESINEYIPTGTFNQAGVVVRPRNAAHVQFIVQNAEANEVPITVKNGGHSFCCFSTAK